MLSSLGQSLSTLYNATATSISNKLSPQAILASYLSKSLAEFFHNVDPNQVETCLTSSKEHAHVSLKDVQFKPRLIVRDHHHHHQQQSNKEAYVLLTGTVKTIEFSWKWGSSSSSGSSGGGGSQTDAATGINAYITDVQLRVTGVRIFLSEADGDRNDSIVIELLSQEMEKKMKMASQAAGISPVITTTPSPPKDDNTCNIATSGSADWKARYMQQILDHLTLVLSDIEIKVDLPSRSTSPSSKSEEEEKDSRTDTNAAVNTTLSSSIILVGSEIELQSLGGSSSSSTSEVHDNNELRQQIRVGSISSHILRTTTAVAESDDGNRQQQQRQQQQQQQQQPKSQKIPLLDEFGYRAIVKRISGRRFLDGIMNGLVVTGVVEVETTNTTTTIEASKSSSHQASNMIRLHAGSTQIDALLKLQNMLGIIDNNDTDNEEGEAFLDPNVDESAATGEEEEEATAALVTATATSTSSSSSNSSFFNLPIQYISLVLEEQGNLQEQQRQTEIKLDGCTIYYRTDGSEFSIDCGSGGILVDNKYVTQKGLGHVVIDLVKSCIIVDPYCGTNNMTPYNCNDGTTRISTPDDPYQTDAFYDSLSSVADDGSQNKQEESQHSNSVIRLTLETTTLAKLWKGIQPIMDILEAHHLLDDDSGADCQRTSAAAASTESSTANNPWILSVNGIASCRTTTVDGRWLEASVDSLVLCTDYGEVDGNEAATTSWSCSGADSMVRGMPFSVGWAGIDMQCSCSKDAKIVVPTAKTATKGKDLVVTDTVQASVDSMETLSDIQSIIENVTTEIFGSSDSGNKNGVLQRESHSASSNHLPFRIIVPKVFIVLCGGPCAGMFNAFDIAYDGSNGRCFRVEVIMNSTPNNPAARSAEFVATNIEVLLSQTSMKVKGKVELLGVQDVVQLETPIEKIDISFRGDWCSVTCTDVNAVGKMAQTEEEQKVMLDTTVVKELVSVSQVQATLDLPFNLKFVIPTLRLTLKASEAEANASSFICIESTVTAQKRTTDNNVDMTYFYLGCKSCELDVDKYMKACLHKFESSLAVRNASEAESSKSPINLFVPGLGYVHQVSMKTNSIRSISIAQLGCLKKPLDSLSATLEGGTISFDLDTIDWELNEEALRGSSSRTTGYPLPCPINLHWKGLLVSVPSHIGKSPGFISVSKTSVVVQSNQYASLRGLLQGHRYDNPLIASVKDEAFCRIGTSHDAWLQFKITTPILSYSVLRTVVEWQAIQVQCSKMISGGQVSIPASRFSSSGDSIHVEGTIEATFDSSSNAIKFKSIFEHIMDVFWQFYQQEPVNTIQEPLQLNVKQTRVGLRGPIGGTAVIDNVEAKGCHWKCSQVVARGFLDNEAFFEATNFEGVVQATGTNLTCSLSNVCVPGIGRLTKAVGLVELRFENDVCNIACGDIAVLLDSLPEDNSSEPLPNGPERPTLDLPFDVNVTTRCMQLHQVINDGMASIHCEEFCASVIGSECQDSARRVLAKVVAQCKSSKVELADIISGSFHGASASLQFRENAPKGLHLPGFGTVNAASLQIGSVPDFSLNSLGYLTQPLSLVSVVFEDGIVSANLPEVNISTSYDSQRQANCQSKETQMSMMMILPVDFKVSILSLFVDMLAESGGRSMIRSKGLDIFAVRTADSVSSSLSAGVECRELDAELDQFALCSLQGFTSSLVLVNDHGDPFSNSVCILGLSGVSQASILVESVTKLSVSNSGYLTKPLSAVSAVLENGVSTIVLDEISFQLAESQRPQNEGLLVDEAGAGTNYALPCPINLNFQQLVVTRELSRGQSLCFLSCGSTEVHLLPGISGSWQVNVPRCSQMHYMGMVKVPAVSATASFNPNQANTIEQLAVLARKVELTADFRSDSWSDSLGDTIVYSLPYVHFHQIDLVLNFKGGKLVSVDDAVMRLPEFKGGKNDDSISLTKHYVGAVKSRVPFLLTKANICGTNVGDSVGQTVAAVAMNSTIVGSVVGVVGRDAVGATITKGKSMRGAGEAEGYRFGDLSRGIAGSVRSVASNPCAAATSAVEYTSENRVKLSGAGGAGLGMVAGMALAGPIGLVAGSIIGSRAARSAVSGTLGDPKDKQGNTHQTSTVSVSTGHSFASPVIPTSAPPRDAFAALDRASPSTRNAVPAHSEGGPFAAYTAPSIEAEDNPLAVFDDPLNAARQQQGLQVRSTPLGIQTPVIAQEGYIGPSNQNSASMYPAGPTQGLYQQSTSGYQQMDHRYNFQQHTGTVGVTNYQQTTMQYHQQQQQSFNQGHLQSVTSTTTATTVQYSTMIGQNSTATYPGDQYTTNSVSHQPAFPIANQQASQQQLQQQSHQEQSQGRGYKFGDITKGIVSRGKERRGQDANSGYKFGDFTRGLFG